MRKSIVHFLMRSVDNWRMWDQMIIRIVKVIAILGWLISTASPFGSQEASAAPKVMRITAHLLLERSGELSANIGSTTNWQGWNTIIGEGNTPEPARDVLVKVWLSNLDYALARTPLSIVVIDSKTRNPLARRTVKSLVFDRERTVVIGLYVPEATCTPLLIEASIGQSRSRERVDFRCGE